MAEAVAGDPGPVVWSRCPVTEVAEPDSAEDGTGSPDGALAGTELNAPESPVNDLSCSSGLMASRSANPTDASPVGSAIVYSAPGPVTRTPPRRSLVVMGLSLIH